MRIRPIAAPVIPWVRRQWALLRRQPIIPSSALGALFGAAACAVRYGYARRTAGPYSVVLDINPSGALASEGYKIYRDDVFLALVDDKTRNYNDFNVIAGARAYKYEVRAVNNFGEGLPGKAIGFQVPNGVVTGWIQTPSGLPVPDALVTLTPLQGFSAKFGATDGAFALADTSTAGSFLPAANGEWTLAFWVKTANATANAGIVSLHPFPLTVRPMASAGGHSNT